MWAPAVRLVLLWCPRAASTVGPTLAADAVVTVTATSATTSSAIVPSASATSTRSSGSASTTTESSSSAAYVFAADDSSSATSTLTGTSVISEIAAEASSATATGTSESLSATATSRTINSRALSTADPSGATESATETSTTSWSSTATQRGQAGDVAVPTLSPSDSSTDTPFLLSLIIVATGSVATAATVIVLALVCQSRHHLEDSAGLASRHGKAGHGQGHSRRFCHKCGAALGPDALFCGRCGCEAASVLSEPRFCSRCGVGLLPGSLFCGGCGSVAEQPRCLGRPPEDEDEGPLAAEPPGPAAEGALASPAGLCRATARAAGAAARQAALARRSAAVRCGSRGRRHAGATRSAGPQGFAPILPPGSCAAAAARARLSPVAPLGGAAVSPVDCADSPSPILPVLGGAGGGAGQRRRGRPPAAPPRRAPGGARWHSAPPAGMPTAWPSAAASDIRAPPAGGPAAPLGGVGARGGGGSPGGSASRAAAWPLGPGQRGDGERVEVAVPRGALAKLAPMFPSAGADSPLMSSPRSPCEAEAGGPGGALTVLPAPACPAEAVDSPQKRAAEATARFWARAGHRSADVTMRPGEALALTVPADADSSLLLGAHSGNVAARRGVWPTASPSAAVAGPAATSQVITPASMLETTVYIERRSPEEALGARLVRGRDAVIVKAIRDSSLLHNWNESNPDDRISPGDCIIAVNGEPGDGTQLMERMRTETSLSLVVRREAPAGGSEPSRQGAASPPRSPPACGSEPSWRPASPPPPHRGAAARGRASATTGAPWPPQPPRLAGASPASVSPEAHPAAAESCPTRSAALSPGRLGAAAAPAAAQRRPRPRGAALAGRGWSSAPASPALAAWGGASPPMPGRALPARAARSPLSEAPASGPSWAATPVWTPSGGATGKTTASEQTLFAADRRDPSSGATGKTTASEQTLLAAHRRGGAASGDPSFWSAAAAWLHAARETLEEVEVRVD